LMSVRVAPIESIKKSNKSRAKAWPSSSSSREEASEKLRLI